MTGIGNKLPLIKLKINIKVTRILWIYIWLCLPAPKCLTLCKKLSITHSRSWALLEKPPIVQLLKNFPAFYGTRRSITVFTRALHWSLFWARSIQYIPTHPISPRYTLILSTHLRHRLPSCLLSAGFPTNILHAFFFPHSCYMPCPSHPPWLDHSNYTW
jgi:hypothetical protein